ncbi:MAG: hypothetical protein EZS28_034347 [Streblomastix strix]|uniref:Uncharacterized protein n=1 Tax=Streblomastix strix TaxID=222440 RepID=A0A5J4UH47_9EUKA|nr:MAG: hypothetical protein EZS28_034347 [Streblomastix strix]
MVQVTPEPYNREEIDEMLDKKLNFSDQIDAYTKQEDDALLLLKADKSELIEAYSKTEDNELLALKLNISDQIDAYNKTEADALLDDKLNITDQIDAYSKQEDDALLLLKADKSELIDAYSKTEADALLDDKLNITDQIDAYSKQEDDALLLLKADKSELIDAYSKTEDDELLALTLNISDQIDAYSKTEDDALLLLKADKSELIDAYSKTEADALLDAKLNMTDQIDAYSKQEADALFDDKLNISDQIDAYNKQQDDALLFLKADKTELADYVDLTSTQTITGQKQFNSNVCAASFIKSGADNTVVLLGAGGTKPLSEFASGSVDDSNFVKKTGQITQSITGKLIRTDSSESFDNLQNMQYPTKYDVDGAFVKKTGKTLQVIKGIIRKNMDDVEGLSDDDDDYMTRGDIQQNFVGIWGKQSISGDKTFLNNVTATAFVKSGGTNQQVLLANGSTKPLSEFSSGSVDDSNFVKKTGQVSQSITGKLIRTDCSESLVDMESGQYATKYSINNIFVKKFGQATQTIDGNLIRTGSEISFENLQPFQYITKQDAKYGFVQKEGQQVQVIEGKLRKKPDGEEEEEEEESGDDDYLIQKDLKDKFVQLRGTQTVTGQKTFTISVTAPAFVKYSGTNQQVLLADGTVKSLSEFNPDLSNYVNTTSNQTINGTQTFNANVNATGFVKTGKDDTSVLLAGGGDRLLSSFGIIEDLTSSAFSGMHEAAASYGLHRIGNLYIFSLLSIGGIYNVGTINPNYLVQNGTSTSTYIPFPNCTNDNGGYLLITHSTGSMNIRSTQNTQLQCASATWVK